MWLMILYIILSILLLFISFKLVMKQKKSTINEKLIIKQNQINSIRPVLKEYKDKLEKADSVINPLHEVSKKLLFFRNL